MLKTLFFSLILIFLSSNGTANWSSLEKEAVALEKLMVKAKTCVPVLSKNQAQFCTGIKISSRDFSFFQNASFSSCRKKINLNGYKALDFSTKLPQEVLSDFRFTSKRAQTYHDRKWVVFKEFSGRIDCIHELLHIYQRKKEFQGALNPRYRYQLKLKILRQINAVVAEVEALEKSGEKRKAQEVATKLEPYIALLRKWNKLITWLDEKEIYYFIYENCRMLKCERQDREIALANLFRLRAFFPWRYANKFKSLARNAIYQKKNLILKKVKDSFVWTKQLSAKTIRSLANKNLEELVEVVNVEGIFTKEVGVGKESVYCRDQKLGANFSKKTDTVFLLKLLLYKTQLSENSTLCSAFSHKKNLQKLYKLGKLSLKKYDEQLLFLGLLRDYADFKASGRLSEILKSKSSYYNLLRISARLNFLDNKSKGALFSGQELVFKIRDELPIVMVNKEEFILDLGAMNSVYPPSLLKVDEYLKLEPLSSLDLNTLYGRKVGVPKVSNNNTTKVGELSVSKAEWVIASLGIKGVKGLLGLDFFKGRDFKIYPKVKKIEFKNFPSIPANALLLQRDWNDQVSALEVLCPAGPVLRLDTGSQVLGDISSYSIEPQLFKKLSSGEAHGCGPIVLKGPFTKIIRQGPLFERGVSLNLGWPWISQFSAVNVSNKGGWIEFIK